MGGASIKTMQLRNLRKKEDEQIQTCIIYIDERRLSSYIESVEEKPNAYIDSRPVLPALANRSRSAGSNSISDESDFLSNILRDFEKFQIFRGR